MMFRNDFNRVLAALLASLAVAALLLVEASKARAEGWFNPGIEGGSGLSSGEYDLDGDCLRFDDAGDPNTYLCPSAADEVTLTCGGADVWVCNASGCDLAGELGAVTSLDATTLATIVAAISGNGSEYDDDVSVCWGDDDDFCIEHDTDGSPDGLRLTQADCDGSPCNPLEFYKSGGDNVIAMRASSFTNPDGKMTFGLAGASSYACGANCSHFSGPVEFSDVASFGNYALFYSTAGFYGHLTMARNKLLYVGPEGMWLVLSTEYSPYPGGFFLHPSSNHLLVGSQTYYEYNYGYSVPDDPTIILKSSENPATDSTQDSWWTWNRLALGGNGGGYGCINQTIAYDDFTDGGGLVGTLILNEGIPDGAVVQRSLLHSLTGFTGGANTTATAQIGDGTDADRYTTGTPDVYTSNASGADLGVPSGTVFHDDEKDVTVTVTVDNDWGTIAAGEATVAVCYWTP
jgi:hypothetical protein